MLKHWCRRLRLWGVGGKTNSIQQADDAGDTGEPAPACHGDATSAPLIWTDKSGLRGFNEFARKSQRSCLGAVASLWLASGSGTDLPARKLSALRGTSQGSRSCLPWVQRERIGDTGDRRNNRLPRSSSALRGRRQERHRCRSGSESAEPPLTCFGNAQVQLATANMGGPTASIEVGSDGIAVITLQNPPVNALHPAGQCACFFVAPLQVVCRCRAHKAIVRQHGSASLAQPLWKVAFSARLATLQVAASLYWHHGFASALQ